MGCANRSILLGVLSALSLRTDGQHAARRSTVPTRELGMRVDFDTGSRRLAGAITASVRTPFGSIPVTGRVQAQYACPAVFSGLVRYSAWVRLSARLAGIGLVQRVHGGAANPPDSSCLLLPDSANGRVSIRDTVVTGFVRVGTDSLTLRGTAWGVGDSAFAAVIQVGAPGRGSVVRVDFLMRGVDLPVLAQPASVPGRLEPCCDDHRRGPASSSPSRAMAHEAGGAAAMIIAAFRRPRQAGPQTGFASNPGR